MEPSPKLPTDGSHTQALLTGHVDLSPTQNSTLTSSPSQPSRLLEYAYSWITILVAPNECDLTAPDQVGFLLGGQKTV